jgi:hypothetical protein
MTSDAPPAEAAASAARAALTAFAERDPATQADIDQVMRALAAHDDWFVPAAFAERAWGQTVFDQTIAFPEAAGSPVLTVFTDRAAAVLADGQAIGMYVGPVPGVRLLSALSPAVNALIVNPASPRQHQWYIAAAGFGIAATWASTIAVERALTRRGGGPVPAAELLSHRFHLLCERGSRDVAQVHLADIDGAVAVCFTAADRVEEFVTSLPPEVRPLAELILVPGPQLFDMVRTRGAAGVVINAGSDDQTALTRGDLDELTAAPARA